MRGWYATLVVDRLPPLVDVCALVPRGTFYACAHDNIDGSVVLEIASTEKWSDECTRIYVLEFFGQAFLEAGGVHVREGKKIEDPKRRSRVWIRKAGRASYVLDTVDVIHPRALHASDFFR